MPGQLWAARASQGREKERLDPGPGQARDRAIEKERTLYGKRKWLFIFIFVCCMDYLELYLGICRIMFIMFYVIGSDSLSYHQKYWERDKTLSFIQRLS